MDNNWSIDRIEESTAILENITTKEKKEVDITLLPLNIKEGTILSYIDNSYNLELSLEEQRRKELLERFKKLRKQNTDD